MTRINRLYKKKLGQIKSEDLDPDMQIVVEDLNQGSSTPNVPAKVEELPDTYKNDCGLCEPTLATYVEDDIGITTPPLDSIDEAVEIIRNSEMGVVYINIHTRPGHGDNDLGLFFNHGAFTGFGTTEGANHHQSIANVIAFLQPMIGETDIDWGFVLEKAMYIARPDELGMNLDKESDINCVDELDTLDDSHSLSMENVFPAGEGDSSQNTRPGETSFRQDASSDAQSAILALIPTEAARKEIVAALGDRLDEAPEDLHITLAYLGKGLSDEDIDKVGSVLDAMCPEYEPLDCRMQGLGVFDHEVDGGRPFYASVDALGMAKLRTDLMEAIENSGVELEKKYDFTPHMTLGYVDANLIELAEGSPGVSWTSTEVVLMNGGKHTKFKLGSSEKRAQIKPTDVKDLHPDQLVTMDFLMEEGFEPSAPSGEQVYDQLRDKQQGVRTNEYLSGPISTFSGEVYVMRQPSSQVYIYVESAIGFVIETGAQSWHKYDVRKDNITPVIRKIDIMAAINTNGVIKPSKSEIEIAEYLALYVNEPMDAFNQTQIGGELRRILRFASRQAGGFRSNLTELGESSAGGNFEQKDNELSENTQEDPNLKLGDVEPLPPGYDADGPTIENINNPARPPR